MVSTFKSDSYLNLKLLILVSLILLLFIYINALIVGIILCIIIFLYLFYTEKFLLFIIVLTLLSPTEQISNIPRLLIQIVSYLIITILFFKQYGLRFSEYPKLPDNLKYFITLLILLMFISSLNSTQLLLGLKQTVYIILFFYLIYGLYAQIKSDDEIKKYIYAILLYALLNALLIWKHAIELNFDFLNMYREIFTDYYVGKNVVGVTLSLSTILIISLIFSRRLPKYRIYLYILLLILFVSLLATDSRASIIALLAGLSVIVYIHNKKAFLISLSITVSILLIIMISPIGEDILLYLRADRLITGRDLLISSTIEIIKHNFLLGAGPDGTKAQVYTYLPYMLNTPDEWLIERVYNAGDSNKTHNFYLYFFSDIGIGGFILALTLPVIYFKNCIKTLKAIGSINNIHYHIVIALIGSGAFFFIRALVEQVNIITYGGIYYDLPFWLLMSISVFYYNLYVKP